MGKAQSWVRIAAGPDQHVHDRYASGDLPELSTALRRVRKALPDRGRSDADPLGSLPGRHTEARLSVGPSPFARHIWGGIWKDREIDGPAPDDPAKSAQS